jgi:hypothetical protein
MSGLYCWNFKFSILSFSMPHALMHLLNDTYTFSLDFILTTIHDYIITIIFYYTCFSKNDDNLIRASLSSNCY